MSGTLEVGKVEGKANVSERLGWERGNGGRGWGQGEGELAQVKLNYIRIIARYLVIW